MPRHSDATKAAIKNAVEIVALAGEYLQIHRSGSKFKALCPFHNDHNPSLELNPERQSFKCWSCGAGGDVFDFVQKIERVDFPEALRMLAERAGIVIDSPAPAASRDVSGPTKTDLLAVLAWAEEAYREAYGQSAEAQDYVASRGLEARTVERFGLGYAPEERGWLIGRAKRRGFSLGLLEKAGLVTRPEDAADLVRERFRGRLIFPIHDERGRAIGFGGRVLPEVARMMATRGKNVAKYLNSPETVLFQKRKVLYAADLARAAAREAGWVAVVEGYTDVIVAHQVGINNVVGTLGTALGEDHIQVLRRQSGSAVLVFDGDAAGQAAADRALEIFLGHDLDVKVMTLPDGLDPCDYLLKEGAEPFRERVARATDPLAFILERAGTHFDLDSIEGSRRAAEWVLGILSRFPSSQRIGMDLKLAKALDSLAHRLRLQPDPLRRRFQELRKVAGRSRSRPTAAARGDVAGSPAPGAVEPEAPPIAPESLDPIDRELVQIVLNQPAAIVDLVTRITASSLRDQPLRTILQACYDLHGEGESPTYDGIMSRIDDPRVRALAAGLVLPMDPAPLPDRIQPAPWPERLAGVLTTLGERERQSRLRDLRGALEETDEHSNPDAYRALQLEYRRLLNQRPDTKKTRPDPSFRA